MSKKGPIGKFIEYHFRHFNAAALIDAAQGYNDFLKLLKHWNRTESWKYMDMADNKRR